MSNRLRSFTVALGCDGCPAEILGEAPLTGDHEIAIEAARRAARRDACIKAEATGWLVSRHGSNRDLCGACR